MPSTQSDLVAPRVRTETCASVLQTYVKGAVKSQTSTASNDDWAHASHPAALKCKSLSPRHKRRAIEMNPTLHDKEHRLHGSHGQASLNYVHRCRMRLLQAAMVGVRDSHCQEHACSHVACPSEISQA